MTERQVEREEGGAPSQHDPSREGRFRRVAEVSDWLVERISERTGLVRQGVDVHERFSRLGITSLDAVALTAELSTLLGRTVSPIAIWEHPTIESLAHHLAQPEETESSVAPQPSDRRSSAGGAAEPIAVIGMACRFPKAATVKAYWDLLRRGVDAIDEVPSDRWDAKALFDDRLDAPGKMNTRWGGFIEGVDGFEPGFFSISPREAAQMDPQQRVMLELSWEALEDAGQAPAGLRGSRTGVYFGVAWTDYAWLLTRNDGRDIVQHTITGFHHSIVANRVSYVFGLQGPSLSLDTACSSSLVALHQACESLRSGESNLALSGGVNLNIVPESTIGVSKFGALSPDGRCFTFDARANGYVRGEGAGVVVLKRLSDAIADGDPIVCVILGSAVNNDGASNGLTAPSVGAQMAVLRDAYARAGIDPRDVQYVEAHGTGTLLGDPIEAQALGAVLGSGRLAEQRLRIGSVKTNIGHLEAASGVASLIKVALAMRHGELPRSLHFVTPNPHIAFSDLGLQVQRECGPWPRPSATPVAGVSAFGFGGTNCHVVLQGWPRLPTDLVPLSAESGEALRSAAAGLQSQCGAGQPGVHKFRQAAAEQARAERNGIGDFRLAVAARSASHLAEQLDAWGRGEVRPGMSAGRGSGSRGVVWVFSGMGSQWPGMACGLFATEPVARATLLECDRVVREVAGWSLVDVIRSDVMTVRGRIHEIDVACPAIVSVELAVAALLRSWGIEPIAVVGHSIGEVAAACAAGILSLADAVRVSCQQGRIVRRLRGRGAMGLVALSWEAATQRLSNAPYLDRVWPAIQMSPTSTVVAGNPEELSLFLKQLAAENVFCRPVAADVPAHCALLDTLRLEMREALSPLRPRGARIPLISTTPASSDGSPPFDASHWVRNVCDPVLFSQAIEQLASRGDLTFLEVSPHPIVTHAMQSTLRETGCAGRALGTMRRDENERQALLDALAELHALGVNVDWEKLDTAYVAMSSPAPGGAGFPATVDRPAHILALSAKSPEALQARVRQYVALLRETSRGAVQDVCFTANTGRDHLPYRLAVTGANHSELADELERAPQARRPKPGRVKIAFAFTDESRDAAGVAGELYLRSPVFQDAIDRCAAELGAEPAVGGSPPKAGCAWLAHKELAHPALFALQFAMSELWRSWGIEPAAVIGHGVGECVAAVASGVMSWQDGLRLASECGRAAQTLGLPSASGDPAGLLNGLRHTGACPAMSAPRVAFVSTANGVVEGAELTDIDYWRRLPRTSLPPLESRSTLLRLGIDSVLDFGSATVLLGSGADEATDGRLALLTPLREASSVWCSILASLADLYMRGAPVDWKAFDAPYLRRRLEAPPYPWQRARHWVETSRAKQPVGHPLLGECREVSGQRGTYVWEAQPDPKGYLREHQVLGTPVIPGAAFMEMALSAGHQVFGGPVAIEDMELTAPAVLSEGLRLQIVLHRVDRDVLEFAVSSRQTASSDWTPHARGRVCRAERGDRTGQEGDLARARKCCAYSMDGLDYYERLARQGLSYGESFRGVERVDGGERQALARVKWTETVRREHVEYAWHPALLDALLQTVCYAGPGGGAATWIPAGVGRIVTLATPKPGESLWAHAISRPEGSGFQADVYVYDGDGKVVLRLDRLRLEAVRDTAQEPAADWLFQIEWYPVPGLAVVSPSQSSGLAGDWLLFASDAPESLALEAWLAERGAKVVRVRPGNEYRWDGGEAAVVPADPDHYQRLLNDVFEQGRRSCRGVLHHWALDSRAFEERTPSELLAHQAFGSLSVLLLAQSLAQMPWRDAPRLWIATRSAQRPNDGGVDPVHAPLWGLVRCLGYEVPRLRCTTLGVVDGAAPDLWGRILMADCAEDQLLLSSGEVHAPKLARTSLPAAPFSCAGAYLITGGLGALGLRVAAWLVERGARHLALVGRQAPSPAASEAIASMQAAGANVTAYRADASSEEDLRRVVTDFEGRSGALRGVVHAAGILDDGIFSSISREQFERVLRPKMMGAWNLHRLTRERNLDFFVLFSSAASVVGTPGQANYCAANAFLDALAHTRRAMGLPATTINWGPWADVGLAAMQSNRGTRLAAEGMASIPPEEALELFGRILANRTGQVVVVPLDLRQWLESHPAVTGNPLFDRLREDSSCRLPSSTMGRGEPFALMAKEPGERRAAVEKLVRHHVGGVLRVDPERIEDQAPFGSLGLDSLMGLETRNRLESSVGAKLPATLLWTHPTVATLSEYLSQLIATKSSSDAAEAVAESPAHDRQPSSAGEEARSVDCCPSAPTPPAPPSRSEPIAIVGIGCRLPGGADNPDKLWRLLEGGVDAVTEVPQNRWTPELLAELGADPHDASTRWGAFLTDVSEFDARYFGISPREAQRMDPQQRLLLEVVHEALDHAGQIPALLAGSATGVFVGLSNTDYADLCDMPTADAYTTTGTAGSVAAGRISYVFDLRGPSIVVDTACSSSLVAVHLACQSLRSGESELAIAAGVNLILSPRSTHLTSKIFALSPEGRCKTFDAQANGFVRGEGCGAVVLKRLSAAIEDGDPIVAVIRGSAINQDGRSAGLTAPNADAQQLVIRQALKNATTMAADVGYVELHGTGTPLGDPIEFEALRDVYGGQGADGAACVLGALKTNLGHLEAAAGIAGLIKAALTVQRGSIVPNLHFRNLNPRIKLDGTRFVLPNKKIAWAGTAERVAGVSSFGISGTNAHIIVAAPPCGVEAYEVEASAAGRAGCEVEASADGSAQSASPAPDGCSSVHLVVLSERTQEALRSQAARYADWVAKEDGLSIPLEVIAASTSRGRSRHSHRMALIASSHQGLAANLRQVASGVVPAGASLGLAADGDRGKKLAFVFPGQGSQWLGMGRGLMAEEGFGETLCACDAAVKRYGGFSVIQELQADPARSRLSEIEVVQPTLFAMSVALAALWRAKGVEPSAVIGHSMGEVAAACVAGALTIDEASQVICVRSRLVRRVVGRGGMALVELAVDEAEREIRRYGNALSVAAVNGPRTVIISGEGRALSRLTAELEARGVFIRAVKVDYASHCEQVAELQDDLVSELQGLSPTAGRVPLYSTVLGEVTHGESLTAEYWARNLRQRVEFAAMVERLLADGHELFVEVSPHPVLLTALEPLVGQRGRVVGTLRRSQPELARMLESLGELYVHGGRIDWSKAHAGVRRRAIALPSHTWQRERHWVEPRRSRRHAGHPLLGERRDVWNQRGTSVWETELERSGYFGEHTVLGTAVLPGAALIEMALSAGSEAVGGQVVLEAVEMTAPLVLSDERVRVQMVVSEKEGRETTFAIGSRCAAAVDWTPHAHGRIVRGFDGDLASQDGGLAEAKRRCADRDDAQEHYERLASRGLGYGQSFRGVEEIFRGPGEALAKIQWTDIVRRQHASYAWHPALLDALIQSVGLLVPNDSATWIPAGVGRLLMLASPKAGDALWAHAVERSGIARRKAGSALHAVTCAAPALSVCEADVSIYDSDGRLLLRLERLRLEAVRDRENDPTAAWLYEIEWRPASGERDGAKSAAGGATTVPASPEGPAPNASNAGPEAGSAVGDWLLFANEGAEERELRSWLEAYGGRVVAVRAGRAYRLDGDEAELDPGNSEDYKRLLSEVFDRGRRRCRGVVHQWALGTDGRIAPTVGVAAASTVGVESSPSASTIGVESSPSASTVGVESSLSASTVGVEPSPSASTVGAESSPSATSELVRPWELSAEDVLELQVFGAVSVLYLAQALAQVPWRDAPRVWVVTRSTHDQQGGTGANALHAPLWGLIRCLAHELPRLRCTNVDVVGTPGAEALGRVLLEDGLEDQLLLTAQTTHVPRLARARLRGETGVRVGFAAGRELSGSYLISGGLGGLGLLVAEWLVGRGAKAVGLVGRRPPSEAAVQSIARMRSAGAEVKAYTADVAVEGELRPVLADLEGWGGPLRGLVHAAATLEDGIATQMSGEQFERVMWPKVGGAWSLHRVTRDKALDFFVMFSSAASVLGSPGQANYCAANAFLDALAYQRRAQGLCATSINWGPWAEVGLAAAQSNRGGRLAAEGIDSIAPEQGLEILDRIATSGAVQVAVMPLHARQWLESHPAVAHCPFFGLLHEESVQHVGSGKRATAAKLAALQLGERRAAVGELVRKHVAGVLRLDVSRLELEAPFTSLGVDSLMGLEIRNRLEASLDLKLPATLLWNHPNVQALTTHLSDVVISPALSGKPDITTTQGGDDSTAPGPTLALDHHELTADDASRLLADELASLVADFGEDGDA